VTGPNSQAGPQVEVVGLLMGTQALPGGGVREIVYIEDEQRAQGGPATLSMISVVPEDGSRVASYVPWINYYDLDKQKRQDPDHWQVIDPAAPYKERVQWRPYGNRDSEAAAFAEFRAHLAELLQTPPKMRMILSSVGPDAQRAPAPGAWAIEEVAVHVIASDGISAPRALQIAVLDGIALPSVDERAMGALIARAVTPLEKRLQAFDAARRSWALTLERLNSAELRHIGMHEDLGAVTVVDVTRNLVGHEREHLLQMIDICRALGHSLE
jgi:DinB superfamily